MIWFRLFLHAIAYNVFQGEKGNLGYMRKQQLVRDHKDTDFIKTNTIELLNTIFLHCLNIGNSKDRRKIVRIIEILIISS